MAKDFIGIQGVTQTAARTFDFADESGIGANDGTPIQVDMIMQLHAVAQKLMIDKGDNFNGLQENAVSQTPGDQQIFDALVAKIDTRVQNAASIGPDAYTIAKRTDLGLLLGEYIEAVELPENYASGQYVLATLGHLNSRAIPVGSIIPFGSATVPAGWFECNGAAVSRTTYPLLFAAIGATWGAGDGSTTFTLPDLRNRMLAGAYPSSPNGYRLARPDGTAVIDNAETGDYYKSDIPGDNRYVAIVKFIIRAL